jgi:hypothetical protein
MRSGAVLGADFHGPWPADADVSYLSLNARMRSSYCDVSRE